MARKRMVTRTISRQQVLVQCIRLSDSKVYEMWTYTPHISGTKLDSYLMRFINCDKCRFIRVLEVQNESNKYELPEDLFIAAALSYAEQNGGADNEN